MNKTNIFVYIELSKLIANLSCNEQLIQKALKQQAAYFNLIGSEFFSDTLKPEWELIVSEMKQKGPAVNEARQIQANAFSNTIDQMSAQDCLGLFFRLTYLFEKVKSELAFAD